MLATLGQNRLGYIGYWVALQGYGSAGIGTQSPQQEKLTSHMVNFFKGQGGGLQRR